MYHIYSSAAVTMCDGDSDYWIILIHLDETNTNVVYIYVDAENILCSSRDGVPLKFKNYWIIQIQLVKTNSNVV